MRSTGWRTVTVIIAAALTACGSSDEPAGLDATGQPETSATEPAEGVPPTDEATPEPSPEGDDTPEPTPQPTFTQPYLQQENVVELRDVIPIAAPDDATDEELEVIEAYGRYEAAWEQILWGVPFEDTGVEQHAIDPNLTTIREYADQSIDEERVSMGPPVTIAVLSVDVDGSEASLAACIDNSGWLDITAGLPPEPDDPLYLANPTLTLTDGRWKVSRMSYDDDLTPCSEIF